MPAVSPKPYKQAQREFSELCYSLAEKAWRAYMQNVNQELYLIGTKSQGIDTLNPSFWIWSSFDVGNADAVAFIVSPERIRRDYTVEQLAGWIRDRLRTEPMYIFAD